MKYLNTIVTTSYNAAYKARVEKTYSLIRPYCLTDKGANRALKNEHTELDTDSLVVCRVEHTSIQSR